MERRTGSRSTITHFTKRCFDVGAYCDVFRLYNVYDRLVRGAAADILCKPDLRVSCSQSDGIIQKTLNVETKH